METFIIHRNHIDKFNIRIYSLNSCLLVPFLQILIFIVKFPNFTFGDTKLYFNYTFFFVYKKHNYEDNRRTVCFSSSGFPKICSKDQFIIQCKKITLQIRWELLCFVLEKYAKTLLLKVS